MCLFIKCLPKLLSEHFLLKFEVYSWQIINPSIFDVVGSHWNFTAYVFMTRIKVGKEFTIWVKPFALQMKAVVKARWVLALNTMG